MAKAVTKSAPFTVPSAEVIAAVEGESKIAALRSAAFEYESKVRDLERKFEEAMQTLRDQYLEALRLIDEED